MATHEAIVRRRALIAERTRKATLELAERFGIELAPPFPNTRDADHRANNEAERSAINLERLAEATRGIENGKAKADG